MHLKISVAARSFGKKATNLCSAISRSRQVRTIWYWFNGQAAGRHSFTAADILMTTVLRFIRHTDLVAGYPVVDAYVKRCESRPAFKAALQNQSSGYARHEPVAA